MEWAEEWAVEWAGAEDSAAARAGAGEEAVAVPWVDESRCTGCGICVESCPGDAISLDGGVAVIDMDACIRCGECHEFCPQDSIRHDGDLMEWRIGEAVKRVEECMAACEKLQDSPQAAQDCLERFMRHYRNERRIIDEVMERISGFMEHSKEGKARKSSAGQDI